MPRKKLKEEDKKSRITLNINEDLLDKIDKIVDDKKYNRSKFIEELLIEYIKTKE